MGFCPISSFSLIHRFRSIPTSSREPRVAGRIESGVIRVQINEAALDEEISNLEDIAPASSMCYAGPPRSIDMSSGACSFDGERVGAGHDPIKRGVVVKNMLDEAAEVAEELTDLFLTGRQTPFRKEDLSILGK